MLDPALRPRPRGRVRARQLEASRERGGSHAGGPAGEEALALAVLVAAVCLALAAAWDVVGPFPSRGTDWGHYLLYAERGRGAGGAPGRRSVRGRARSAVRRRAGSRRAVRQRPDPRRRLVPGGAAPRVIAVAALAPLGVYAACAGGLWGIGAGLAAAAALRGRPDPTRGLCLARAATLSHCAVLPLVVLALGLLYRGRRRSADDRPARLSLVGIAVMHSTSALVAGLLIGLVLVGEAGGRRRLPFRLARRLAPVLVGRRRRAWPVLAAVATRMRPRRGGDRASSAAGRRPGLARQLRVLRARLARPRRSSQLLLLAHFSRSSRWPPRSSSRGRCAAAIRPFAAIAALAVASIVVAAAAGALQVPFEYRRAVYYLGVAIVVLIGVASARFGRNIWGSPASARARLPRARFDRPSPSRTSALRLPRRLTGGAGARQDRARDRARRAAAGPRSWSPTDACTLSCPISSDGRRWRHSRTGRSASQTASRSRGRRLRIIEGGPEGRRLAETLGIDYVVVDPQVHAEPVAGARRSTGCPERGAGRPTPSPCVSARGRTPGRRARASRRSAAGSRCRRTSAPSTPERRARIDHPHESSRQAWAECVRRDDSVHVVLDELGRRVLRACDDHARRPVRRRLDDDEAVPFAFGRGDEARGTGDRLVHLVLRPPPEEHGASRARAAVASSSSMRALRPVSVELEAEVGTPSRAQGESRARAGRCASPWT